MNNNKFYSFGKWCEDNNRADLLSLWDDDLNETSPYDVPLKSEKLYWIRCAANRHESEQKRIDAFASGRANTFHCQKCDSFAQHVIDEFGEEYFNAIWADNNENDPWGITKKTKKDCYFRCIDNPDHIYKRTAGVFMKTQKCPICTSLNNSVGVKFPRSLELWSDKNEDTPYDHTQKEYQRVYWKCNNGIHEDYLFGIASAVNNNFVCPDCKEKVWYPKEGNRLKLTGRKFGKLTVTSFYGDIDNSTYWNCHCECGADVVLQGYLLTRGTYSSCGNKKLHFAGENSPNWKGGCTAENIRIRNSAEYDEWRKNIFMRDFYTCQCCGKKGVIEAHHIKSFSQYKDLRLDVSNGITLCKDHHSCTVAGSLHSTYGVLTTPEELEEYINNKRKELGINIPFTIDNYIAGEILKPEDIAPNRSIECDSPNNRKKNIKSHVKMKPMSRVRNIKEEI